MEKSMENMHTDVEGVAFEIVCGYLTCRIIQRHWQIDILTFLASNIGNDFPNGLHWICEEISYAFLVFQREMKKSCTHLPK